MKNLLNTELPKRFTDAVSKLYNAFHKGELNALDCKYCAVGNICDNNESWGDVSCVSLKMENYIGEAKQVIDNTGYTPIELRNIEAVFVCGNVNGEYWGDISHSKEEQFKGLCAVVQYLCELDNIPNVMDIQSLFEYENDTPKRQLSEILI